MRSCGVREMAVQDTAPYGRAVCATNNLLSPNEDEDSSVCGVVYIAAESGGGAWQPKPSQPGSNPSFQPPGPCNAARQGNWPRRKALVYSAIGVAVLIAIVIGASVGSRKQQYAPSSAGASPSGTATSPAAAAAKAVVVTTVPFSVRAAVIPPAGRTDYSCDVMFGTDQVINRYTTSIEAAYAAQLSAFGIAVVDVTKLTCNGVSYELPSEATAVDAIAPPSRQLQQLNPGGVVLEVVTEITVQLHEYMQDSSINKETPWMIQVRKTAQYVSAAIMPKVLADVFRVTVTGSTVQVQQLPGVIISSSSSSSSSKKPADSTSVEGQQTTVTRAITDPITGDIVNTQVLTLPTARGSAGAARSPADKDQTTSSNTNSSSSSSSSATSPAVDCSQECSLSNASAKCVNGSCKIDYCLPGWEDCDGLGDNGCEANTLMYFTDNAHCGGCGRVCLPPLSCVKGACSLSSASSGSQPPAEPGTSPGQQQQQSPAPPAAALKPPSSSNTTGNTSSGIDQQQPQQSPTPAPTSADDTAAPAVPKPQPSDHNSSTGTEPPGAAAAKPAPSPAEQPATPHQQLPVEPVEPIVVPKSAPVLYDDFVRITPTDRTLVIDALGNDDLGGQSINDITASLVLQPATGTARVVPADTDAATDSADARPRIEYTADEPVAAGSEVQLYYTVAVNGEDFAPAPATVTVLGAIARPITGLLDCSPTHNSVQGDVLTALSRADDATATVTLPFPVELYGAAYTTATVSSNGWVSFGTSAASEPCTVATSWPEASCLGTGPVLAVFWDDLVPDSVLTAHDKDQGAFIIQWTNVMFSGSNTPMGTFQAYVFPNGTVGYVYRDLFGADISLGSGAIIGIRGPSSHSAAFRSLMAGQQYSELGSTADPHGSWYWALSAELPDYVITTAAQSRSINPGLALISEPQARRSQAATGTASDESVSRPGNFEPWRLDPQQAVPLLVAANSPARPKLLQPTVRLMPGGVSQVATISWDMPAASPAVQQFRLYVAADPLFSELLRQPAGVTFERDIPGSTRSVDVVLGHRSDTHGIYVLLMACNKDACTRACIEQFRLSSAPAAATVDRVQ